MVMMTSVGQLVSADCLSASLINFGLSIQTGRLRWKHSHRQVGLARRCTDEEHADICGVARGIWCADIALNQQRLNIQEKLQVSGYLRPNWLRVHHVK